MRDRPADRAAVAHLRIADQAGCVREDRTSRAHRVVAHQVRVPRHRADRQSVAVVAHAAQLGDPADVDKKLRRGEAHPHRRHQRVPAGQDRRVVAAAQELDRLVDRARRRVLERRRDHASAAARTAWTMLW